jgi:rsbT co-antagonist protein RsbR
MMPRTVTQQALVVMLIYLLLITLAGAITTANILTNRSTIVYLIEHTLAEVDTNGHVNALVNRALAEVLMFARTGQAEERQSAVALLREAQANLTQLDVLIAADNRSDPQQPKRLALQQRRRALFEQVRSSVEGIFDAVDAGDAVALDAALNNLEQLETPRNQLEAETNAFFDNEAAAVTATLANSARRDLLILGLTLTVFTVLTSAVLWVLRRRVIRPINTLAHTAGLIAEGRLDQQIAVTSRDEIGELQRAFNTMIDKLHQQRTALETRSADLASSLETQQQLLATVQQLSAPLLPLWDDLLVLPIVGYVDSQRAAAMLDTLLYGISQRSARSVILDVTGLVALDSAALHFLQQAIQSARLLGAQVALAGLGAATAQAIVEQGLDFGHAPAYLDLRSAVQAVVLPAAVSRGPGALALNGR